MTFLFVSVIDLFFGFVKVTGDPNIYSASAEESEDVYEKNNGTKILGRYAYGPSFGSS